jgi:hypothetical protein
MTFLYYIIKPDRTVKGSDSATVAANAAGDWETIVIDTRRNQQLVLIQDKLIYSPIELFHPKTVPPAQAMQRAIKKE